MPGAYASISPPVQNGEVRENSSDKVSSQNKEWHLRKDIKSTLGVGDNPLCSTTEK